MDVHSSIPNAWHRIFVCFITSSSMIKEESLNSIFLFNTNGARLLFIIILVVIIRKTGLYNLWIKKRKDRDKILLEDALKFIYDCEYKNIKCTPNGVAGNLSISSEDATNLLTKLHELNLIKFLEKYIELTSEGRIYALRVIRIHRLWEKYLAEETNVKEVDWHTEAEFKEHTITAEEAENIAAKIGNPVYFQKNIVAQ